MTEEKDIDAVDITAFLGAIIATASGIGATGTLLWGLIYFGAYGAVYKLRRSELARRFAQRITDDHPRLGYVAPILLPGPKEVEEQTLTLKQTGPIDVRVVDAYETDPFWKRATKPLAEEQNTFTGTAKKQRPMVNQQEAFLQRALKRLPAYVNYKQLPAPPSKLSVPIGVEAIDGTVLWGDFSSDGNLIHALVAGYTGSGKDALLRLWFSTLTLQNTPDELQFVILDGKIDWLSPALAESAYMAIKPAGGIEIEQNARGKWTNVAQEEMIDSMDWIFKEIKRRSDLMTACGAVDLVSYQRRTGKTMPYLFVLASDVGDTFGENLELLVKLLISRGRSYGVRLIISMQNPVGEDTGWRSQIGLIMSGYQQFDTHDRYIFNIHVNQMLVRPSQLPNPQENAISKGLFVTRLGTTQHLVRTGHMPEEDWYRYIEQVLPKKRDVADKNLLSRLLLEQDTKTIQPSMTQPLKVKQPVLTTKQINLIQEWTFAGRSKTEIMVEGLKFSNGALYKEKSPAVDIIINAAKRKMK